VLDRAKNRRHQKKGRAQPSALKKKRPPFNRAAPSAGNATRRDRETARGYPPDINWEREARPDSRSSSSRRATKA